MILSANKANAFDFTAVNNGQTIYYNITSSTVPLTVAVTYDFSSYNTYSGSVDIPDSVTYNSNTYAVTSIGLSAFRRSSGLTSVTIPNTVTAIGDYAFYECSGLTVLSIPHSVTTIGRTAFYLCNGLTSVTIPNSVTALGEYAFYKCAGLTSVTIGNSVTSIGMCTFEDCTGLTSVTIPNSVTAIGNRAFAHCTSLTSITIGNSVRAIKSNTFEGSSNLTTISVDAGNSHYSSVDGVLYDKSQNILWICPGGKTELHTIPPTVTLLGYEAFSSCKKLTAVTLPLSVNTIGKGTFDGCSGLTSINIPNSVVSIDLNAFANCRSLPAVTIPHSVVSIGGSVFYGCSGLTDVTNLNTVPQDIEYYYIFSQTDIKNTGTLTVPTSAVNAYKNAADWKAFATITGGGILFSAKSNHPGLDNVTANIPDGLYPAGTSVTITVTPSSSSFLGWKSGDTDLGNTTSLSFTLTQDTVIMAYFRNTASFHLDAPGMLKDQTNIRNITHLTLTGNIDARDVKFMRDDMHFLTELDLTNATVVAYSGQDGTIHDYDSIYPANEMPNYAFLYDDENFQSQAKTTLISVKLPAGLTSIGSYAFYDCRNLTGSLIIPDAVTYIGGRAFFYCSSLTGSLIIPDVVTYIGDRAFNGCSSLTGSLIIPDAVTYIGDRAFSECSGLTSVTFGNSVTSIGNYAFDGCSGLTGLLIIPNSVTSIGYSAFSRCSGLISVSIGNSVTIIWDNAFYNCSGLTSVSIGNSVTNIWAYAFENCSGIAELYVKAVNPPTISSSNVFSGVSKNIPVHVPCGSTNTYKSASVWNSFSNIIDDLPVAILTVESKDIRMGSVSILQANTCTDNTAIIQANAYNDYLFVQWTDGNTSNPRTITVTSDTTFTAEFMIDPNLIRYRVTLNVNDPRMGTVSGNGDYRENTTARISANANNGYRFVQWNDDNTENPRSITVTQDTVFEATFEAFNAITTIKSSSINVYPNPTTDNIHLTLPENVQQAFFTLYDMQGKELIKQEVVNEDKVMVNDLAAGIYIYKVATDKESYQGKISIKK
jgi:hypothetical protein